jgi:hypothetical protein
MKPIDLLPVTRVNGAVDARNSTSRAVTVMSRGGSSGRMHEPIGT